jgi:hypothetical protein
MMALRKTLEELQRLLDDAVRTADELHITVADAPKRDSVLVDLFDDAAGDVVGWLREAQGPAGELAERSRSGDLDALRPALAACQDHCSAARHRFADAASFERIGELEQFRLEHSGSWRAWASAVRQALTECQSALAAIDDGLLAAWQELAEAATGRGVTVHTTAIGQQITAADPELAAGGAI